MTGKLLKLEYCPLNGHHFCHLNGFMNRKIFKNININAFDKYQLKGLPKPNVINID